MSKWKFIHENFHAKHSMFTEPDAHMHTSLSYTSWSYNQQTGSKICDQFICLVVEKKTEAVKTYKEGEKGKKGTLTSSRKDWTEFYGCIK